MKDLKFVIPISGKEKIYVWLTALGEDLLNKKGYLAGFEEYPTEQISDDKIPVVFDATEFYILFTKELKESQGELIFEKLLLVSKN